MATKSKTAKKVEAPVGVRTELSPTKAPSELAENCKVCGKPLSKEASMLKGEGHRCETLLAQGLTGETLTKHYAALAANEVPEGWLKLFSFHGPSVLDRLKAAGGNINKVVKAVGRDRVSDKPAHPIAQPVYVKGVRYVNPWLFSDEGMKAIATGDFSKAPEL